MATLWLCDRVKRSHAEGHFPPLQKEGDNSNREDILMWPLQRLNKRFLVRRVFVTYLA